VPQLLVTCEVCGKSWEAPKSRAKGRRTCSTACSAVLKRKEWRGTRTGEKNPNYKNGSRVGVRSRLGEERWYAAAADHCEHPECPGPVGKLAVHHIVFRQELARCGGDIFDPRNAMTLCSSCHMSFHRWGRGIDAAWLPDSAFEFARETLGAGRAYEYLIRHYKGQDDRLDALLAAWEQEEAA
jgi:5-methylcytosine-specific restriction endonuclease McrA